MRCIDQLWHKKMKSLFISKMHVHSYRENWALQGIKKYMVKTSWYVNVNNNNYTSIRSSVAIRFHYLEKISFILTEWRDILHGQDYVVTLAFMRSNIATFWLHVNLIIVFSNDFSLIICYSWNLQIWANVLFRNNTEVSYHKNLLHKKM